MHAGTGWDVPDPVHDASETDLGKLLLAEFVSAPVTVPLTGAGIVTGTESGAGIAAGTEVVSEPVCVTETVACHVLASVRAFAEEPALAKRLLPVTVMASAARHDCPQLKQADVALKQLLQQQLACWGLQQ